MAYPMTLNTLFIFAKPNRIGLSKTRLARDVGKAEAQRINAMATSRVMRVAQDPRWQTALMVAPDNAITSRQPVWPDTIMRLPQGAGDLGDRMSRAYNTAPLGKVVFVGTDMPDLRPAHIWQTIKMLNTQDAVFGPADDGGFWLCGLNKRIGTEDPFFDVRWSSEHTLDDVTRNLGIADIGYLDTMIDLDDGEALSAWTKPRV